jgi:methyl-accepting chemotaxis protein
MTVMKSPKLALRVTLNSVVMIMAVYLVKQTITFIRDNIIFGLSDYSALPGTVGGYIVSIVLPPIAIFGTILFMLGLRLQRVQERLERGETLPPELLETTRKRMLGFAKVVITLNLIGFTLGYVLSMVLTGKAGELVAPPGLLNLLSNLVGGLSFAYAQNALNNLAFAGLRERLGFTSIGERRRELPNTTRQLILTVVLATYLLTMVQMNIYDLSRVRDVESATLEAVRSGQVAPADADADYRQRLAVAWNSFSNRKNVDFDKIPLPWERGVNLSSIEFTVFMMFGLFAMAIGFGIQLAWSADLRAQLLALAQRLRDVVSGGGDLTKRIKLKNMDVLGEITELVNQMLDQFHGVVRRIGAAAGETRATAAAIETVITQSTQIAHESSDAFGALKDSLEQESGQSRRLVAALEAFGKAAQGVEDAVEAQRHHVNETSAAMEEMSSSIESVEDMTRKAKDLTGKLAVQGQGGGQAVRETAQAIGGIEESARQVMRVLGELNKIAASTNLLAMNAAIEAAHAGDSGKGFAVVADEVRKLANDAGAQTKHIQELIRTMSERVGKGVRSAQDSGQALGDLVSGLDNASAISGDISVAMREQATGTRQAADSLLRIVEASETIHQRVGEQSAQTRTMEVSLAATIADLERLMDSTREQTRKTKALEESFAAVRTEVERNGRAVRQLQAEIERFKVD